MPAFYVEEVDSLKDQLGKLPAFLRKLIEDLLLPPLEKAAPAAFGLALTWLEQEQRKWNNVSAADPVYDEVAGIAHGACVATGCADEAALRARVMQINLLPELIQMQCSMMGAWGAATPTGHLTQLRTLDFGEGPFANASVLVVHHPKAAGGNGGAGGLARPWASLGFTGYARREILPQFCAHFSHAPHVATPGTLASSPGGRPTSRCRRRSMTSTATRGGRRGRTRGAPSRL